MCDHANAVTFYAKACDGNLTVLPSGHEVGGYLPSASHGTDGLQCTVCLDCGQVRTDLRFSLSDLRRDIDEMESAVLEKRTRSRRRSLLTQ
jgi:hypothetical protein